MAKRSTKPLHNALRLNAGTCLGFGALFVLAPALVSSFLGAVPELALLLIGGALIFNGLHLLLAARRESVSALEVTYFAASDFAWFIASLVLLATGAFITTAQGAQGTLAVAALVFVIGLRQLWCLAQFTNSGVASEGDENCGWYLAADLTRGRAIGASWMGLKTWVKIWLFALNAVFLSALIWWPSPIAKYTIVAFAASGPLLFAFMIMQRGLTRLLGLAHLIPWLPLLGYFWLRLNGASVGPQLLPGDDPILFGYVCLLMVMITICLLFDLYDIARWLMGHKGRLGSPSERIENA